MRDLPVVLQTANTMVSRIIKETLQLLARSAKSVERITILRQFAKVVQTLRETTVDKGLKKERARDFMKLLCSSQTRLRPLPVQT